MEPEFEFLELVPLPLIGRRFASLIARRLGLSRNDLAALRIDKNLGDIAPIWLGDVKRPNETTFLAFDLSALDSSTRNLRKSSVFCPGLGDLRFFLQLRVA